MKLIIALLLSLLISGDSSEEVCEEPVNVWFRVSNDINSEGYGNIIELDMSKGYADTDGIYVYLFVQEKNTPNGIIISFPIGYWETEIIGKPQPKSEEQEKPFDLDEYLRKNKHKGLKIHKIGL